MSDLAYANETRSRQGAMIGEEMGRVRGVVSRLSQAKERLRQEMHQLETILDRLCGGVPKGPPISHNDQVRPTQPDLDELDDVTQSIIDRCSHLEELVKRACAI